MLEVRSWRLEVGRTLIFGMCYDVSPIIQTFCNQAGCHNAGSVHGPGPLTNYTQVFNARVAIKVAVANGTMPKTGTLTTAQKNSIICWVDSGAPNN